MDPTNGDVSRAMRNRCVEVCILPTTSSSEKIIDDWRVTAVRVLSSRGCTGRMADIAVQLHWSLVNSGARVQWRQLAHFADTLRAAASASTVVLDDEHVVVDLWQRAIDVVYIAAVSDRVQRISKKKKLKYF